MRTMSFVMILLLNCTAAFAGDYRWDERRTYQFIEPPSVSPVLWPRIEPRIEPRLSIMPQERQLEHVPKRAVPLPSDSQRAMAWQMEHHFPGIGELPPTPGGRPVKR